MIPRLKLPALLPGLLFITTLAYSQGHFTDVADSLGVAIGDVGSGVAWGDFNNDGYQDLYVSTPGADYAFQNTGNSFIPAPGSLVNWPNSAGVAWADYDNDGRLDLFVANMQENVLFHNEGDYFTDVAGALGLANHGQEAVAWADYDNDGANRLFRNDGTVFTEVSTLEGVADSSHSTGCAWGDYDRDGDLDLYVVNDQGQANRLYRNDSSSNHWLTLSLVGTESSRDAIGTRVTLYTGAGTQTQQVEGGHGYCSQNSLPLEFGLGSFSQVDSLVIRWTMTEPQVLRNLQADQFLTVIEGHRGLGPAVLRVPEDYPTIQQALNAAFAGDTIRVNDGVYQENLIWPATHGLYLTSVHGAQHTVIDGMDSGRVMTIHFDSIDPTTVIEGFTIQNGNAYDGGG
ncbi:MAG: FG-GAP-like repeat-containing protein, partial [bacterium]